MAFTYLAVNSLFIIAVTACLWRFLQAPTKAWWLSLVAILVLTFVFDNLMIMASFFHYEPSLILGVSLGVAPIEDFFYALLAVIVIPALWNLFGTKPRPSDTINPEPGKK